MWSEGRRGGLAPGAGPRLYGLTVGVCQRALRRFAVQAVSIGPVDAVRRH